MCVEIEKLETKFFYVVMYCVLGIWRICGYKLPDCGESDTLSYILIEIICIGMTI